MNDDIIRMYEEANGWNPGEFPKTVDELKRFAALVAAAERDVIAQSLDKQADLAADDIDRQWAQEMAAAVRARGNV